MEAMSRIDEDFYLNSDRLIWEKLNGRATILLPLTTKSRPAVNKIGRADVLPDIVAHLSI